MTPQFRRPRLSQGVPKFQRTPLHRRIVVKVVSDLPSRLPVTKPEVDLVRVWLGDLVRELLQ
jgi:hypothetical protein